MPAAHIAACVDRYLPGADPLAFRDPARRLVAQRSKLWPAHQRVIHVRFLGGDPALHQRIAGHAQEWSAHAAVAFVFDDDPHAAIRIGFDPGPSWSYLGTDALDAAIGHDQATMNLGWLTAATSAAEVRRVVLHEFGHVLGLIHEHQNPTAAIPWDREAVYAFYGGWPNFWDRAKVDRNVFELYSRELVQGSDFDPDSIMLYPIPPALTGGRFSAGWNNQLSDLDRAHIRLLYPPAGA